MDDTVKYLIHADVTADGVVERSDVVGAIFGQTEGLLGDQLDLRDLQQSSKVGRIDVEIESEQGQSFGHVTIETSLDKVATATLAAALETIERIGPCRSTVRVTEVEDVRAAKRRRIVDRATELLVEGFSDTVMSSEEILQEVRERVRVEDVTRYDGLPAGPRVVDSDAVVVVEGRADVVRLLQYGVKNAIAVEGTDVPDAIVELTRDRMTTVFLDGDRGGELILEELSQVGEIDYVAFAPPGQSVEDLDRDQVFEALQEKVPYETVAGTARPRQAVAATDGSTAPAPDADADAGAEAETGIEPAPESNGDPRIRDVANAGPRPDVGVDPGLESKDVDDETDTDVGAEASDDALEAESEEPETIRDHVTGVVDEETGLARFLDDDAAILAESNAEDAFDLLEGAETVPATVVLDGVLTQRLLDVAAQRGVGQVVAREFGAFTKRPTDVRIRTADQLTTA